MSDHKHPLGKGEVRKERVPTLPYAGEGCEEHYDERVIFKDDAYRPVVMEGVKIANPYLKAIVMGEVLSTPRSKVPFRKK